MSYWCNPISLPLCCRSALNIATCSIASYIQCTFYRLLESYNIVLVCYTVLPCSLLREGSVLGGCVMFACSFGVVLYVRVCVMVLLTRVASNDVMPRACHAIVYRDESTMENKFDGAVFVQVLA